MVDLINLKLSWLAAAVIKIKINSNITFDHCLNIIEYAHAFNNIDPQWMRKGNKKKIWRKLIERNIFILMIG